MPDDAAGADSRQVSPILRIPTEIASEIFQHCLPDDEFPRPSVICAPVQLTRVCSAWRTLAIRTPYLWLKVLLCTTNDDFGDTSGSFTDIIQAHAKALEIWMMCATPLLLSIHLRYPILPKVSEPMASMKKLLPLFLVVVENAARWKSVGLSLPRDYLVHAWYLTQEKVRNVESFDIDDTSIPLLGRPTGPLFMQDSVAESLSTLSVRAELCYPSSMAVPLMRLQTLSLKHTSPVRCLDLLKYCPVLENLNLHFYDAPVSIIPFEHPTILVPELRTFHLSHTRSDHNADISFVMDHGGGISSLLDYLQLPHLQEFYLWTTIMGSARFDDSKMPWDYLSRLITRSNCSLSRLEIYSPHIDTPSTLECLRLSPDLKYLGVPADKELERKVSELLPGLETLHIFK